MREVRQGKEVKLGPLHKLQFLTLLSVVLFLPWLSFDFGPLKLSPSHFFSLLLVGLVLFSAFLRPASIKFRGIDFAFALYLVVILFNAIVQGGDFLSLLLKLCFYIFFMIGVRSLVDTVGFKPYVLGAFFGILFFLMFFFYCAARSGSLGHGFDYQGLVLSTYEYINSSLIGRADFEGKDVLRSVIGEVFAFYVFIFIFFAKNKIVRFVGLSLSLLASVGSFSRRSVFASLVILGSFFVSGKNRAIGWIGLFFFFVFLVQVYFFAQGHGIRIASFELHSRWDQFLYVVDNFNFRNLFLGEGYGEKVYGHYVHNFFMASLYMLGLPGLMASLVIVGFLVKGIMQSFIVSGKLKYRSILVIPFLGMMVGSTVDGMMSIVGWLSIALAYSDRKALS